MEKKASKAEKKAAEPVEVNPIERKIIDEDTFERLDYDISFEKFHAFNLKCIRELSDEDRAWVQGLTSRIEQDRINIVDEESGIEMPASNIYFDKKKKVCIVCPR